MKIKLPEQKKSNIEKNNPNSQKDIEVSSFIESSISRKLDVLKEEINEIYAEINNRENLHSNLISELDTFINTFQFELEDLLRWGRGSYGKDDSRRMFIEKNINDFLKERRLEELWVWKDKNKLKEDIRELSKEYRLILKRKEFLKDYLTENSEST